MTENHRAQDHKPDIQDQPAVEQPALDAIEVTELARHRDPSRVPAAGPGTPAKRVPGRGVVWMRPSDLVAQASAHVAGRGIDFQAELARRVRRLPAQGVRAAAAPARALHAPAQRLSPRSASGLRPSPAPGESVSRTGIGMG